MILRHLLPIAVTTAFLFAIQLIVSIPFTAVAFIDEVLVFSELAIVWLVYLGRALTVSFIIVFPLALLLEGFALKAKILIVLIPIGLFSLAGLFIFAFIALIQAESTYLLDLPIFEGILILTPFSIIFAIYWACLWLERGVLKVFKMLKGSLKSESLATRLN